MCRLRLQEFHSGSIVSMVREPEEPMSFAAVFLGPWTGKAVCVKGLLWIRLVTDVAGKGYKEQGRQF